MKARTFLSVSLLLMSAVLALSCQRGVAPDCSSRRQGTSYHAHQTSCSLFYRCEDGILDTFSCPPGQFFNEKLQTCDLADNVDCNRCQEKASREICDVMPTCSIPEWGEIKPYPPNCTLYIYCDQDASYKISSCPKDLEFSPSELSCMSPELANCPKCEISTTTEVVPTIPTNSEECSKVMPTCVPYTDWGELKSYPYDCNQYIFCDELGNAVLSFCPGTLHFSETLQACLIPEEAECIECTVPTTTEEPTTTIPPCNPVATCGPLDAGLLIPYPPDCQFYIYCIAENNPEVRRCASGKHFSPIERHCVASALAGCQACIPT